MGQLVLILFLTGCSTYHSTIGDFKSNVGEVNAITEPTPTITPDVGYDADAYDECVDRADTTTEECQ